MSKPRVKKDSLLGIIVESNRLGLVYWPYRDAQPVISWYNVLRGEIHGLVIYNMTWLINLIRGFLVSSTTDLTDAIIAFDQEGLGEMVVNNDSSPLLQQESRKGFYAWSSYSLLEPYRYIACFPYHVRAQYHLLSLKVPFKLVCMTTVTAVSVRLLREKKLLMPCTSLESLKAVLQESAKDNTPQTWNEGLYKMARDAN